MAAEGGSSQQFRSILRKVIDFGPLPNAGTDFVPHGIVVDYNFTLIQMFASATDPVALQSFSIPLAAAGTAQGVTMFMDATYVYIITQSNRSSYTRCFVVIEFLQEL